MDKNTENTQNQKTEGQQEQAPKKVEDIFVCAKPACGKAATMQCPTCIKYGLAPSYFCGQDCFKSFWSIHKYFHKATQEEDKFKYTGKLRPGKITPKRFVPSNVVKPDWADTGIPTEEQKSKSAKIIEVYSPEEIEIMREVCLLGRKTLDEGHRVVNIGATTDEIDQVVHKYVVDNDAYPSPLNYYNFRKSLCTSVNEVICHGIPDTRPLEDGDIVNLDVSVFKKNYHSDLNETYFVGKPDPDSQFLVEKTYRALEKAISICKPGVMYKELGNVIEKYVTEHGLSVVRTYCGHGVGKHFHCAPNVPHYGGNKTPGFMKAGHIFTIEPMINQGVWKDVTWPDDWTAVTADGKRSAQFEHTILITEGGAEVLTKRLADSPSLGFNIQD